MGEITAATIAGDGTILRGVVGSQALGTALPGTDDRDEMGIAIPPKEWVLGLRQFDTYVYRDAPDGERSKPGDLDLTVHSLRKWAGLALNGNPSVTLLLFLPRDLVTVMSPEGAEVRASWQSFASRRAISAFLGYLTQQKERLAGERGQKAVKRPELVAAHGFDTKYAGHVIRLGLQGVEYGRTGRLTLPLPEQDRQHVLAIRRGEVSLQEIMNHAAILEADLVGLRDSGPLPERPDYDAVQAMLVRLHEQRWETAPR